MSDLWTPFSASFAERGKDSIAKSKMGNKFGTWAGRDLHYLNLPGGATLSFDLSRLTLQDYRQMLDHYQVSASVSMLTFMMHGLDWHITGGTSKQRELIENNLRERWTQLVRGMSQAYPFGFSPMVIDYENDSDAGAVLIDRFKDLVPEDCAVNWKTVEGYAPPGHARPKFFEYDGIVQHGSGGYPIPPENTLWYPLLMQNGDYYGRKLLKPAFPSWFFSILMHLFSNRYFERFGEPVPIGRADFEDEVQAADGSYISGRQAMENIIHNLRNRAVVVLPSDRVPVGDGSKTEYAYDLEYLESQMRGADFERYMTRLDEEISLSIFTPLLMLRTADVGSYNLGVTHAQVYLWMLNALAGDMKEYIDQYVVKRLARLNFGKQANDLRWTPRPLGKDNVETIRAIITQLLSADKVKLDVNELSDMLGMTVTEVKELSQPQQVPGDPNQPPQLDTRVGRPERANSPRPAVAGPANTQPARRQIANRIASQLNRARKNGNTFQPTLGHRRQLAEALGVDPDDLNSMYGKVEPWLAEVGALGLPVEKVIEMLDRVLEGELANLQ